MKDFLGNELKVGDTVVCTKSNRLHKDKIEKINAKKLTLKSWGVTSPEKVMLIVKPAPEYWYRTATHIPYEGDMIHYEGTSLEDAKTCIDVDNWKVDILGDWTSTHNGWECSIECFKIN